MTIISLKKPQVYSLGKLNSKELYNILILGNYKKTQCHKGISSLSLNPQLLIGKIFICYHAGM